MSMPQETLPGEGIQGLLQALDEHVEPGLDVGPSDIMVAFRALDQLLQAPPANQEIFREVVADVMSKVNFSPSPPDAVPLIPELQKFTPPTAALRQVHHQLGPLQNAPQWQLVQATHGAMRDLGAIISRAARGSKEFWADARVQGFIRTIGQRVTGVIARASSSLYADLAKSAGQVRAQHALKNLERTSRTLRNRDQPPSPGSPSTPTATGRSGEAASQPAEARTTGQGDRQAAAAKLRSPGAPPPTARVPAKQEPGNRTKKIRRKRGLGHGRGR
ncbi:hypothetical protein ACFV1N_25215 [Streptosporangium canum]|uniref:hypothetical protein n=1 Tax=Streptosporangium canum TaxID=324952 RepID=UPI0036B7AEA7